MSVTDDLLRNIARLQASPFLRHKNVRGLVYDVQKGTLREVS